MKNLRYLLPAPALLLVLVGLAGCASSRSVSMNSLTPADMTFSPDIRTILIVDRTEYHDGTVGLLEGVITGEIIDQDRAGLQAMIIALRNQLAYSDRFETRVSREVLPGNSLTSVFPDPLDWDQVDALVREYESDVVLSIEIFDSDFIITDGRRLVKKTVKKDDREKEIQVPEYFAEGVANLTIGLRIYDPAARDIIDEDLFNRTRRWEAKGTTVQDAVFALIDQADAASVVSREVGVDYAYKIAPMPVRISRTFYGKSKRVPEMEMGGRHADVGDWVGAARVWESGLTRAEPKDAGRLAYNIAIANEVLGNWETARQWAERSYVEFGNKDARDYVKQLERRVRQEEVAMEQMR